MPELNYENSPLWQYQFPIPSVDLSVDPIMVTAPSTVRAVGVDGRERGVCRRFPGFRYIENALTSVSNVTTIERVWYTAIQKGTSPYQLRGFVTWTKRNDNHYQAYFRAYDTQLSTWATYELLNFSSSSYRLSGIRLLGSVYQFTDSSAPSTLGMTWDSTNKRLLTWTSIAGPVYVLSVVDPVSAVPTSRIVSSSSTALIGISWNPNTTTLYASSGSALYSINTDTATVSSSIGNHGVSDINSLSYRSSNTTLYALGDDGATSTLYTVDVGTGAVSSVVALGSRITEIVWDNDNDVLYGATTANLRQLATINISTGVVTNVSPAWTQAEGPTTGKLTYREKAGIIGIGASPDYGELFEWRASSGSALSFDSVDFDSNGRFLYGVFSATDNRRPLNFSWSWDVNTSTVVRRDMGALHRPAQGGKGGTVSDGVITGTNYLISYLYRIRNIRTGVIGPLSFIGSHQDTFAADGFTTKFDQQQNRPGIGYNDISELQVDLYRTIGVDTASWPEGVDLTGPFYLDPGGLRIPTTGTLTYAAKNDSIGYARDDNGLASRAPLNPLDEYVGIMPRTRLILCQDSQNFIVSTAYAAEDPSTTQDDLLTRVADRVLWSPPGSRQTENFRGSVVGEQYRPTSPSSRILGLERVDDATIVIMNNGLVILRKSGSYVSVNPLELRWGAVSRDAVTGAGGALFIVTHSGLKALNPQSLQVTSIDVVQRLLNNVEYWKTTLSSVQLYYDYGMGCLILFNSSTEEMYLLWTETGAITSLEDCSFFQGVEGPDVTSGDVQRTFFINSAGAIFVMDAEETAQKKTMCGLTSSDTANGTATSGTTTTLTDSTASFSSRAINFYVHFLSGANAGLKRKISAVSSTQLTWVSALPNAIAATDRYSVAPIPFRVRGSQLWGHGGFDMWRRKIATVMNAAIQIAGGETSSVTNPNLKMTYSIYQRRNTVPITSSEVNMSEDSTVMAKKLGDTGVAAHFLFPEWVNLSSNLDFRLLAGRVMGTLTTSDVDSSP